MFPPDGIGILSNELIAVVLQDIHPAALLRCCCVCKTLLQIVEGDDSLVPDAVSLLCSVRLLNLRSSSVTGPDLGRLLSRFPYLEELNLSHCLLRASATEHMFSAAFDGCTNLTALDVSDSCLTPPAIFGNCLPPSLTSIDVSGLRDPLPEALWRGIAQLPRLRALRTSRRAAGNIDAAIAGLASSRACQQLELLDVGLCCEQGGVIAQSVGALATACPALRCLDLSMVPHTRTHAQNSHARTHSMFIDTHAHTHKARTHAHIPALSTYLPARASRRVQSRPATRHAPHS